MLLFILIPVAWLSVLALLVAVCRTASTGDRLGSYDQQNAAEIGPKLVLGAGATKAAPPRRRAHAQRSQSARGRTHRPRTAHVGR
jgi:hypothetical protein